MKNLIFIFLFTTIMLSCRTDSDDPVDPHISVESVFVNDIYVSTNSSVSYVDFENVEIRIELSHIIDTAGFNSSRLFFSPGEIKYHHSFRGNRSEILIRPSGPLMPLTSYRFTLEQGANLGGIILDPYTFIIRTRPDSIPKFPVIPDNDLLTLVQEQTFRYFWDYAHPVSGLARERYGSGDLVTTGGSGFGLMAILVGIERNFITRDEGFERIKKIVQFLSSPETDKFQGVFPHWLNGATGETIPFSFYDNGGDLVETAFLMQGLITVKEYFRDGSAGERALGDSIQVLWENVNWDWYRKEGENVLYWHWSPDFGWQINLRIQGWNEALIVYILAASSPTYPVSAEVYHQGWARGGAVRNGDTYYNIILPLGEDFGGPLFFAHYSFLGLDPRNLADQYADYWTQNVAHARINREYCIDNPRNYAGYSGECWGLTASDIQDGYTASSPTNDRGVIAPTAALSSFPYTPEESMNALKFFYYVLGDRLWGEFGFHDAFNLTTLWFADSYLAIDQGPIICMIENYRTGLLWDLFMSNKDIQEGLTLLAFTY